LIEEEIALGELDAVHVLRHLLHKVGFFYSNTRSLLLLY
jgi:hypothetical protein